MNKLLLAVITLAASLSAVAQGTLGAVNVNNNFTVAGAAAKAFVNLSSGLPLPKAVGRVEVLDNSGAVISSVKDGTGNTLGADGLFFLGVLDIPGSTPGNNGSITIRAWDMSAGATYDAAVLGRASTLVTLTGLGGGAIPPPGLATAGNFVGLTLSGVPEPSTVALAALGVAGLFFVVRRK